MLFLSSLSLALSHWVVFYIFVHVISITAETVAIFSVTSAHKGELPLLQMNMLKQFEFATNAWYMLFFFFFFVGY